ncbi:hypothetical protein B296_00049833, partial [Ensete ventricosum]
SRGSGAPWATGAPGGHTPRSASRLLDEMPDATGGTVGVEDEAIFNHMYI